MHKPVFGFENEKLLQKPSTNLYLKLLEFFDGGLRRCPRLFELSPMLHLESGLLCTVTFLLSFLELNWISKKNIDKPEMKIHENSENNLTWLRHGRMHLTPGIRKIRWFIVPNLDLICSPPIFQFLTGSKRNYSQVWLCVMFYCRL